MQDGYVKLYRVLLEKPIWKQSTPEQRNVLIALMLMANHKENEWEWKGKSFKVNPGQFVTSLESIRKKAGPGISIQNVRSALMRFENLEFLTSRATKSGRIISIINWKRYQPKKELPNKDEISKSAIIMMLQKTLKSNIALNKDEIEDIINKINILEDNKKGGQQRTQQRGNKGATTNKNDKNDKNKKKNKKKKKFIPPSVTDVINYFIENGYTEESAIHAFKYYSEGDPPWTDSRGNKVRGWKQKMRGVWFRDENKQPETKKPKIGKAGDTGIYDN